MKVSAVPIALTVAGSDSGGGAGIQMDLKVFASVGVYGTSVITAATAQNSVGVRSFRALPASLVQEQLAAVLDDLPVGALKTGMLWSAANVRIVAEQLERLKQRIPLVIDPVIWAKDGSRLLSEHGVRALARELLPLATVITPNLGEVASICGIDVKTRADARHACERLVAMGAASALVKGGHLPGVALDTFYDGRDFVELRATRRTPGVIHGTGCALSAALAAHLAKGYPLPKALTAAHTHVQGLIRSSRQLGAGSRLLIPEKYT